MEGSVDRWVCGQLGQQCVDDVGGRVYGKSNSGHACWRSAREGEVVEGACWGSPPVLLSFVALAGVPRESLVPMIVGALLPLVPLPPCFVKKSIISPAPLPAGAPMENLVPVIVEDVSKEGQCAAFVKEVVAAHGPIDHAVSCFGAWWQKGVLTEQSYEEFSAVIANFAGSHFVFSKYVLPQMRQAPTSSFLYITGGVGELLAAAAAVAGVGQLPALV